MLLFLVERAQLTQPHSRASILANHDALRPCLRQRCRQSANQSRAGLHIARKPRKLHSCRHIRHFPIPKKSALFGVQVQPFRTRSAGAFAVTCQLSYPAFSVPHTHPTTSPCANHCFRLTSFATGQIINLHSVSHRVAIISDVAMRDFQENNFLSVLFCLLLAHHKKVLPPLFRVPSSDAMR